MGKAAWTLGQSKSSRTLLKSLAVGNSLDGASAGLGCDLD